ncbi:3-deoxy-D-manno-octulosonic acid transferase [Trichloromonas sp.]|uniref:3-deoxy-D-manno-octulosonic acid transferase n=1 Tax=Trichloromonas sp. TaxID=3069249 RepID=UPI002A4C5EC9|nr:3-deoxy-D-manno-octulosonic acid transferase [Trichloromonas sp.]
MYRLYDLVLLASAAVLIPYYLYRGWRRGKARRGIRERLGFYTAGQLAQVAGRKVLWVHAVSVGETRAAVPLLKRLKSLYPEHLLVLSNVTETGRQIARDLREVDLCLFFPFDLSWVVNRVLRQVRPDAVIIVETEIWPNFIHGASRAGIPVILVNGRISDRSFPRYCLARRLIVPILEQINAFCMQTELDAQRIVTMGARLERVLVTGNLKFDMQVHPVDSAERERLWNTFHLPPGAVVWVAGSTHPGEEEIIVSVYRELVVSGEPLFLILVPRHPERCRAVREMLVGQGFGVGLRSALEERRSPFPPGEILLVDTLGEMLTFYALADLVFVGGSLVPVGGHNVLEASIMEKPVVFGSYMHNFKEISSLLLSEGAGLMVDDRLELLGAVRQLLADAARRTAIGRAGAGLLERNAGATDKTMAVIDRLVP